MTWEKNGDPVAEDRFRGPIATERHQPHNREHALSAQPLDTSALGPVALASVLSIGPTGQGAVFEFAEPVGAEQYQHLGGDQGMTPAVVVS